ncbi:MAG: hypothetical protein IPG56_06735 [Caulobacteraceae bacterium]|nr:hypothetical protein [Caulobacteraceae bacterium]
MRSNAPAITELRLQRFHRWALLWLKWFAAFLNAASAHTPITGQAAKVAHQWLARVEAVLISIVLVRAGARVRPVSTLKHSARRRIETHMARAIIGSAMRRSLRPRRLRSTHRGIVAKYRSPGCAHRKAPPTRPHPPPPDPHTS